MCNKLVAYFSVSGITAKTAKDLAEITGATLDEIQPNSPYTDVDLNWNNKQSRSSVEMNDLSYRPEIINKIDNMGSYHIVFLGFPIWWYIAPTIINTFLENYDFSGKTIVLFATSGGSGFGKTRNHLIDSISDAAIMREGNVFHGQASKAELKDWIDNLKID